MSAPEIVVAIPVGRGREANLNCVLDALAAQERPPGDLIVVSDDAGLSDQIRRRIAMLFGGLVVDLPKHEPGMEQPRNVAVRVARDWNPDLTHVAFLDSDVVVAPDWLELIAGDIERRGQDRILVCPYDWLGGSRPGLDPDFWANAADLYNDPRWAMFREHDSSQTFRNDLSKGLGCFSGNLVWPIDEFMRVGGFWSEIHHGRCEDGELGLRAVAMDVPIGLLREARGWHLHHEVNIDLAIQRNARDVPMLNDRHPWMEQGAVFMVDRDGKAFDVRCRCGEQVPTILWWEHASSCPALRSRDDKDALPVA